MDKNKHVDSDSPAEEPVLTEGDLERIAQSGAKEVADGVMSGVDTLAKSIDSLITNMNVKPPEDVAEKMAAMTAENTELKGRLEIVERTLAEKSRVDVGRRESADTELDMDPENNEVKLAGAAGKASDLIYIEMAYRRGIKGENPETAGQCNVFKKLPSIQKALDSTTDGSGSDYVPTGFSTDFIRGVEEKRVVAALFNRIPMTTQTLTVAAEGGYGDGYRIAENTAPGTTSVTETNMTTQNFVFSAKTLGARLIESYILDEDAMPVALMNIRGKLMNTIVRSEEDCMFNGDTTATHMDSDIEALGATDRRTAWDGFRRKCLTNTGANVSLATPTAEAFSEMQALMGDYGEDIGNLAWFFNSYDIFTKLRYLKDSDDNLIFQQIGQLNPAVSGVLPGGSIPRGMHGLLNGIPVYSSKWIRRVLNASAVYAADGTYSVCHLVWLPAWSFGDRRGDTLEVTKTPRAQTIEYVVTRREDFQHAFSSDLTTAMGYAL